MPPHVAIRLTGGDRIAWREDSVHPATWRTSSRAETERMVAIIETMNPQPYLVVEVAAGADCDTVRWLAETLEQVAMCREEKCVERAAWENYSDGT